MTYYEEAIERIITRYNKDKHLEGDAYDELVIEVNAHPEKYLINKEDESHLYLALGLHKRLEYNKKHMLDNIRDKAENKSVEILVDSFTTALKICPDNLDAWFYKFKYERDFSGCDKLLMLSKHIDELPKPEGTPDIYTRPYQRLIATYMISLMKNGSYRQAIYVGEEQLEYDPSDPFNLRNYLSLCYARLEDAQGFEELEERFGRTSNSWTLLARSILFYKTENLRAAERTLIGYTKMVEGAAYFLFASTHEHDISLLTQYNIPQPLTAREAYDATGPARAIIGDTSEFLDWAIEIPEVRQSAQEFQEKLKL